MWHACLLQGISFSVQCDVVQVARSHVQRQPKASAHRCSFPFDSKLTSLCLCVQYFAELITAQTVMDSLRVYLPYHVSVCPLLLGR